MQPLTYTLKMKNGDTHQFEGCQSEFVAEGRMFTVTLSHGQPHMKTFSVDLIAEMTAQAVND